MKRLYLLLSIALLLAGCDLLPGAPAPTDTPTSPTPQASPTEAAATTTATATEPAPTDTPTPINTLEPPAVVQPVLRIEPAASLIDPILGQDPADPQRLAYCTTEALLLSDDGGANWEPISLGSLGTALAGTDYELRPAFGPDQPACLAVTLDSTFPDSLYLTAEAQLRQFGAPPVFFIGFYTSDRGQNWQLLPLPEPGLIESFGGFWSDGQGTVQVLYGSDGPDQAPQVQQTTNGGVSWSAADLACPPLGPCLRWGAAPSNIPGMGSPLPQVLFHSVDGGDSWLPAAGPVELRFPGPSLLAIWPDRQAELLSGYESPYLQQTSDGGASWQPVDLPPLPGASSPDYPGLQPLPDGAYLAQSGDGGWYRWQAGQDWCPLPPDTLPARLPLLRFTANQALWLDPQSGVVNRLPLAGLQCSQQ